MKRRILCYGLILSLAAGIVGLPAQAFEITISDSYSMTEEDQTEEMEYDQENYPGLDAAWLLDIAGADGIDELLVVTEPDENGITYFRIYATYDEEISMIYEESAGTASGERKAMYLLEDGYGNYAFFYYYPGLQQGYNTDINVFALKTYGGQILLKHESVSSETNLQDALNNVVAQFGQLNPYWQMLFNTLSDSEQEELQTAFDKTTITFELSDSSKMVSMSAQEKLEQYLMLIGILEEDSEGSSMQTEEEVLISIID